ncbi:Uncharacterised protein [Mycobacteroides abscessus]|nr:Uncharacterised protein [Mycobacteroides abscessus]
MYGSPLSPSDWTRIGNCVPAAWPAATASSHVAGAVGASAVLRIRAMFSIA